MAVRDLLKDALPFIVAQRAVLKEARDPAEYDARQLISSIESELSKKPRKKAANKPRKKAVAKKK